MMKTKEYYHKSSVIMNKCKHLDEDESCLIIKQLTGEEHYPSQKECVACSRCHEPQTVNEITSALSNKILIKLDRPTLYKIGHGPGTRLKKSIAWFIDKGTCDGCEEKSKIMDAWGVAGCKRNTKTIIHWLAESAHLNNINITRIAIEMILIVLLNSPYRTSEKASNE